MVTDYEVTFILRPQLEETELDERVGRFAQLVRDRGGEVLGEAEKLGKKRLAYEIADAREGHYVSLRFKCEPDAAKELERQMKLSDEVLRQLILRADEK